MAIENSRFKTRKEREEEEKKRKASEERFILPTYEELNAIEEKAKEDAARVASSEKGLDFFQRPSNWDDGYQFGDVTKTALGTLGDVGVNAVKGVVRMGEGIGDAAQYGAAALADLFGADEKAEAIRQNAQRDKVTEAFSGVDEKLNKYSVLGRTSDAAAESLGQIGAIVGTAGLAGALGAGAVGTTAATTGLMGLSSFGSGTGEAYAAGADEGEAEAYGAIAGAADALSEMIFGGLGKGFKALGLSKGITSADDLLAKAVTSKIRNALAKNAVQLGIKAGAEGLEEVLAGTMQAAGKKATYMSERDFADIIKDENLLEQFVVGAMASGISQTPSFVSATRAGVDLVSNGADAASDSAQDVQEKFAALRDKNADFGEIERTGLASGAKDEDIRMAGELSTALGKKIRFFREDAKNGTINNGEYHEDTGEIWINTRSKNVKAQIVAHELTHSIEKNDGYQQLVDLTMNKLEAEQKAKGKTLDDLYREKETLYADGGVRLASYDEITSELVAEYVEKRLLTDEASIKSLVSENRTLGQRIREWFDSLLAKMGNASAKEREYIRQMRDMYARALGEDVSAETSADGKVRHSFVGESANIDKSQYSTTRDVAGDLFDRNRERTDLDRKIREIENSEEYKTQTKNFVDAFLSGDEQAADKYNQYLASVGYNELKERRSAVESEIESLNNDLEKQGEESERAAIEKSGLTEAEFFRKKAVREFGYTPSFGDAGYITANGKMLNFSGEKGKHFGTRGQDHRAIGNIYENTTGSAAMYRFMRDGNVRVMAGNYPGIDLSSVAEPTKEQYATIRKFANEYADKNNFHVDLTDEGGHVIGSLSYENRINAERIISEIKRFYATGEIREQTTAGMFHGEQFSRSERFRTEDKDVRHSISASEIDGSPIDAERISSEEGDVRYSITYAPQIEESQKEYIDKHRNVNVTDRELEEAHRVTEAMVDVMMKYSDILPEDKIGKVLTNNGSYDRSVENTTICVRTLAYNEFVDRVQAQIGRPLTQMESFLVSQKLYDIATDPQCMYCYVSLDRKSYNEMLLRYMQDRDTVIDKYNKSDKTPAAIESLYEEFLAGRKDTKNMRDRFDKWISYADNGTKLLSMADIATEARQTEIRAKGDQLAEQLKDARAYAQSASWSKIQKDYVAYRDEILKLGDRVVKDLNKHYGMRWYSFSDYSAAFIVENMQQITDAAIRGLKGLSYTKDTDFAKIFAPSGMNINISVFVKQDKNGNYYIDDRQSANFEEALALREEYPNVGIVATVTDDGALRWAGEQEWSDVIIPFHIVRTGTDVASFYKWLNYTAESGDTIKDRNLWEAYVESLNPKTEAARKKVSKNVYPSEHHNDKETYLNLCESRGLTPRFARFAGEDWYMKLVNETRRSADETPAMKPVFNEAAAKESFAKFVDKGGYSGGWYREGVDVDAEAKAVAADVLAGKKADEVSYGRQDVDAESLMAHRKSVRSHGVKHSVSREDASVTEAETDQTMQQIRNDIAADEARYRELSDTVMSNERFNAMMPDEQNAILDEMQSLRERIDRENQIMQDMSYEQDMGDDVPVPGDENDPLAGVSSAVETEVQELDVNSAAYDGYKAQMPTDEDVYQSTAEQGMYDDMEAEYAELIRDKRKEDADKRKKQKAKDRRVEERLNRQYEDALTWRFGAQTPISEERLMEDAQTVESMGEREFLKEQGFGYRDMMDQMHEDAAERYKEWRETQKQERAHLREVEDDLNRQFEQAEKERREINRRQREEDRKRRIERGEIQTVAQRLEENLRSAQLERSDIDQMRRNASEEYQMIIDDIQERYDALKNKNTAEANTLLRRISRTESRARTEDEAYQKRIYDIDEKIGRIQTEIQRKESPTEQRNMRRDLHESILYRIKEAFSERGIDFDKVLVKAKDLSTFATVDNTPQRVMEKSLGYKEGRILSDLTIDQAARNETEGIRWLNRFTDRKDGVLAKLSKKYNIKPGSKESAAAQMYAEGFYVSDKNEIVEYGDRELAADFPDAQVRENIKGLAHDPIIRQIYDETLDAINASRTRNAFPEIQKLDNYYLHFRAMDDTFSRLGIPFNPNDIRAKDLPTDLNGVTADLKPGQPYFASAKHRLGKRTSFDLLGGMEKYLTSAKNQIYHIDDIQTLRALRNYVADMYGQAEGLSNLDDLSDEEVEARIKDVYGSHLSTFAKFLNEEANVLAGKTSLIDRGLEGVIGRRGITFLNDVNRQVGANMVGYNISSSLTNFLAPVQAFAKMNKAAFVKGFAQTVENRMKSITGNGDDFAQKSDVIVRRKGADRFHRTAWQKMSDPGYLLMGMVDDISTEIIARAKYNELTAKGMDAETANRETDKWVSRLMGDRSLGQMPQIFNSKMLGLVTKFQLEVRNQLDSQFYDTIKEAQVQYEEIGDKAKRNAKTAAKVAATFAELALAQHVFGTVFESIAGYNPAFDIIEVIATVLGLDDDEESEDTALDNIEQGVLALIEDLPYSSVILDGGRIPVSSAMPIGEIIKGQDEYGNDINRLKTVAEAVPYYALPGGYGQIKKTAKGLSMFSGDKAVTGSYTDSGNLRFPVDATPGNIAQAAVFGQWASENARDYFDNERKPANKRQTMGYAESGLEWKEFQRYRDQISKLERDADKLALIKSLDIDQTAKKALYRHLVASAKKDDDGNIIGSSEDERLAALYRAGLDFRDFADAKLKQAELNADTSLTANQRATRFYAWAASEGYTDEQADAITEQFKFSSGFKVEPTQYKKLIGGGVSPDNAVLVTDALSGASRAIDKINAIWSTGLTGKQLDNAVKAVVTEGWYERYRKVVDANVPLDVLTWVLDNADANGNDSIDNEERTIILSQLALSRKELSALWEATGGSEKSNPYSGNGGNKSGGIGVKIEMPKIEMPKIEMPKIELPKIGG